MSDRFVEVTNRSWFGRIKDSIAGTLFGLLLFLGAFVLLFWNEGRAVKTHEMLQEGAGIVISVAADKVDAANEGKLVHVTGAAETGDVLGDPIFDISVNALKLRRKVEMLQWKESSKSETRKKLGGGTETETTYTYSKEWSESLIDASRFRKPEGHRNPDTMIMESESWQAGNVNLGAFKLTSGQVSGIDQDEQLPLKDENRLSKQVAGKSRLVGGIMYLGSKQHDRVGDYRIEMRVVYPTEISVISGQKGDSFEPYQTKAGGAIQMLHDGIKPAAAMFEAAEAANTTLTWILRFVGLMVMFFGLKMIVRILSVLADVVPLFGNIVGAGTSLIAFLIALTLSLITIAIAWVFYRPLISGILIVVAVGTFIMARSRASKALPQADETEEASFGR